MGGPFSVPKWNTLNAVLWEPTSFAPHQHEDRRPVITTTYVVRSTPASVAEVYSSTEIPHTPPAANQALSAIDWMDACVVVGHAESYSVVIPHSLLDRSAALRLIPRNLAAGH